MLQMHQRVNTRRPEERLSSVRHAVRSSGRIQWGNSVYYTDYFDIKPIYSTTNAFLNAFLFLDTFLWSPKYSI